jgi:hypothetical protein
MLLSSLSKPRRPIYTAGASTSHAATVQPSSSSYAPPRDRVHGGLRCTLLCCQCRMCDRAMDRERDDEEAPLNSATGHTATTMRTSDFSACGVVTVVVGIFLCLAGIVFVILVSNRRPNAHSCAFAAWSLTMCLCRVSTLCSQLQAHSASLQLKLNSSQTELSYLSRAFNDATLQRLRDGPSSIAGTTHSESFRTSPDLKPLAQDFITIVVYVHKRPQYYEQSVDEVTPSGPCLTGDAECH